MKKTLLIVLLAICTASINADELTDAQVKTEIAFDITLVLDAAQTIDLKNRPAQYEKNPLLGKHPSEKKVIAYFATMGWAHYELTKAMPNEYRKAWQYGWIAAEIFTIIQNKRVGASFSF
jgi:hypothetical protein